MPGLPLKERIEKKEAELRQLKNRLRKKSVRLSADTRRKRTKFFLVYGLGAAKLSSKEPALPAIKENVLPVLDKKDREFFTANYDVFVGNKHSDDTCEICAKHGLTTETVAGLDDEMEDKTYSSAKELFGALNAGN